MFATLETVGADKAEATARALRDINPELELRVLGREWMSDLDAFLPTYRIVVNGMDDVAAGIHLYRRAREHGATVIDAYSAPLPSVFVTRPGDPRPEERLGYPTRGTPWERLTPAQIAACKLAEATHVMLHSSSLRHFDLGVAAELFAGKRPRASFAPMVILTGTLMASEAVKLALGRTGVADHRGAFFNPWTLAIERPRSWLVAAILRPLTPAPAPAPDPALSTLPLPNLAENRPGDWVICRQCESPNRAAMMFCLHCGAALPASSTKASPSQDPVSFRSTPTCVSARSLKR